MRTPLGFFLIVERGDLEAKALLLVESLRRFAGPHRNAPVWAVQPRAGRPLRRATLDALARHDVAYLRADLNRSWADYGPANKPYAAAFLEELLEGTVGTLVLLDSDLLFVRSPDALVLGDGIAAAVRPVDEAHLASRADTRPSAYWDFIYRTCGAPPERWWNTRSTVDQQEIRAYFNAGLVAVRPQARLFRRWLANLERVTPHAADAAIFPTHRERWFLDQATLAATLMAELTPDQLHVLGAGYNYPLHKQRVLPPGERLPRLGDAVAVHYHDAFYHRRWARELIVDEPYASWLASRLPLPRRHAHLGRLRRAAERLAHRLRPGQQLQAAAQPHNAAV